MISKIKQYITRNEFTKNTLILISGTVIAQLLPIAISPILTRLYTPEQFGVLSLFTALSILFGNTVAGKYEQAILLPQKKNDAIHLLAVGTVLTLGFAAITLVVVILFAGKISVLLKTPQIKPWLFVLPLSFTGLSLFNLLNYYGTRKKDYKLIALSKINRATATSLIQIGLSFLKTAFGLISGLITGYYAGLMTLFYKYAKNKEFKGVKIKKHKLIALARYYKKFPFFSAPATLINRLATDMPNYLIPPFFGINELGLYALAFKIMSVPSYFIGDSISQVYTQEISEELRKTGSVHKTYFSTLKKLTALALPFFLLFSL